MNYVTSAPEGGGRVLSVAEAALALGVDRSHVRLLIRRGLLQGERFGSQWAVQSASLETYRRHSAPVGRPFSEKIAWSLLARREQQDVPWTLHREELSRIRRYESMPLRSLAQRLRGRARPERLSVGPAVRERLSEHPRWKLGGLTAAGRAGLTVVYVPDSAFEALFEDTNAVIDVAQPNLIAQVVGEPWWPFGDTQSGDPVWESVAELDRFDAGERSGLELGPEAWDA